MSVDLEHRTVRKTTNSFGPTSQQTSTEGVGSSSSLKYDHKHTEDFSSTYATVLDEDTSYKASHTLGADGVSAVGGTVKANHKRKVTSTCDSSGSTSGASTQVNKYTSESDTTQNEQSTYEDTSSGRKIGGSARTEVRDTTRHEVEASSDYDSTVGGIRHSGNSNLVINNSNTTVRTTIDTFGKKSSQTYKESFTSQVSELLNEYDQIDYPVGSESATSHKKYGERIHINPDGGSSSHTADLHFWGTGDHWAGAEPIETPPGYTFPEWDTYEVKWNDDAPTYADHWDARAHYNANDPPEAKKHNVQGGATPDPGRVSASIDLPTSASWWNPADLIKRKIFTGEFFAPDLVYSAALEDAGIYYESNADEAHEALDAISIADPIGLTDGVNVALYSAEGDFENAKSTAKWAAAGPVGDVIRLARNAKKGLGAAQQLGKNSDKADDVVQFGDGVVSKAPKIDDPVLEQMRIENKAQQLRNTAPAKGLGDRILSAAERAEFNKFADRARAKGYVENPNRTGSWGEYVNGKFREKVRLDVGEAGMPGWRGKTHINLPGSRGHFPPDTPF